MKVKYKMDRAGVIEIAKSAAVREQLGRAAAKLSGQANSLLHAHNPNASHEYKADVHVLDRTAIGTVHTTGFTTEQDQAEHRTLNAINH